MPDQPQTTDNLPAKLRSRLRVATFGYAPVPIDWINAAADEIERLNTALIAAGPQGNEVW